MKDALPILPQGARLVFLNEIDSTSAEAQRIGQKLEEEGGGLPIWIWALRQSMGRGRRGRVWVSEPGNLFCTQLRACDTAPLKSAQLSFAAALAVIDALQETVPELAAQPERLEVKWPNDVLLDRRKVSGILLESFSAPPRPLLAIGIGVNLVSHPSATAFPATDVRAAGFFAPDQGLCLSALAASVERWSRIWATQGFAPIRRAWLARAAGLGRRINIVLPHETLEGTFADLSERGELLLACDDGQQRAISAGDVFFGS